MDASQNLYQQSVAPCSSDCLRPLQAVDHIEVLAGFVEEVEDHHIHNSVVVQEDSLVGLAEADRRTSVADVVAAVAADMDRRRC